MASVKSKDNASSRKAVSDLRALRQKLRDEVPGYDDAVVLEHAADAFCQSVRRTMKALRKQAHVDQNELGKRMNLSQSAVSKIEIGQGDIGLKSIFRFGQALGMRPVVVWVPSAEDVLMEAGGPHKKGATAADKLQDAAASLDGTTDDIIEDVASHLGRLVAQIVNAKRELNRA